MGSSWRILWPKQFLSGVFSFFNPLLRFAVFVKACFDVYLSHMYSYVVVAL